MSDYRDKKSFTCILNYVGKNVLIKLLFWCDFLSVFFKIFLCVCFWCVCVFCGVGRGVIVLFQFGFIEHYKHKGTYKKVQNNLANLKIKKNVLKHNKVNEMVRFIMNSYNLQSSLQSSVLKIIQRFRDTIVICVLTSSSFVI